MKKTIFLSIIAVLLMAPTVGAIERIPAGVEPSGATVVVPEVAISKAPPLEMITIIHYKKDFAKPESPGKSKPISCYGFISGLAKLLAPADLFINADNSGMSEADVLSGIQTSATTWDEQTSTTIFGSSTPTTTANFDSIADGRNEISFGDYSQAGVIAVTRIWGYFSGKPSSRYISQFDILFDTDYTWGDANFNSALMDFQNIATHELGHGVGLADIYSSSCIEVTMYGYSNNGEVEKRTLESPDITGLRTLYGI